jgi:hypothetical protein
MDEHGRRKGIEPELMAHSAWRQFREELEAYPDKDRRAMVQAKLKEQRAAGQAKAAREGKDAGDYYEDVQHHAEMLIGLADLMLAVGTNTEGINLENTSCLLRAHAEAIEKAAGVARWAGADPPQG